LFKKVKIHIDSQFPFLKNEKLLLAISGGMDSMVAASILKKLRYDFVLAHCNFKLRGQDADLDEQFVKDWAKKNKIICFVTHFNTKKYAQTNKLSIEMAARNLRYQWFNILLKDNHLNYIITAHHANDNFETTLFNLTRGTGFKGLLGIPSQNGKIIRPLLPFSRDEIKNYAIKNKISWREDKSNASIIYSRNKIRHQVVPVLKTLNPNLITSYNKSIEHLKSLEVILNNHINTIKKDVLKVLPDKVVQLDIDKLLKLSHPKAYMYELLKDYGFTAWSDIEKLINAQTGKQIYSKTHRIIKNRNLCLISPIKKTEDKQFEIKNLNKGLHIPQIKLTFEKVTLADYNNQNNQIIYVDAKKIKIPLMVRKWQNGDYFYPLGMTNKKKLSDFFKDQKLSLLDKENTWLLCQENKIIWVIGQRLSNLFKVTNKTTEIIKIKLLK